MKPDIVFDEDNILICNKTPGVASQSERSFEQDLQSSVMTYLKEAGREPYAAIINRLDKPVGGLVLFACNKRTASLLSAMTGDHSIEKSYYAVVKGRPTSKGEFEDYLMKDSKGNLSRVVGKNVPQAKKAKLLYEVLEEKEILNQVYSLVRIRLLTGRHHQIRVQFASRGYGLYGDMKYNPDFKDARGITPALFAYQLSFHNPSGLPKITVAVKPQGEIWDFDFFRENP